MLQTSKPLPLAHTCPSAILLAFSIALIPQLTAQVKKPDSCTTLNLAIVRVATALKSDASEPAKRKGAVADLRNLLYEANYVIACGIPAAGLALIPSADFEKLAINLIDQAQVDKQVGANGGTGGSTSLISHGLAPSLLGFAFETGGIERDIAGTVVTVRANPATLIQALAKKYGPGLEPPSDTFLNALNRMNFAASFDTNRSATSGATAANPFRADYQQLTDFSVRVALWNGRDPYRLKNWLEFNRLSKGPLVQTLARLTNKILEPFDEDDLIFQPGLKVAISSLLDGKDDKARESALTQYNELLRGAVTRFNASGLLSAKSLKDFSEASSALADERRDLADKIAHQALFNFEYTLTRPPLVTAVPASDGMVKTSLFRPLAVAASLPTPALNANPDLSAARLVGTWRVGTSDLSWNAAATFFNSLRPGMSGNFRDFNTGVSASTPLGTLPNIGKVTATVAGRFMYLHQKPLGVDLLFNSTNVNQPGNIGWLQAKLTFPGPAKAIKIPISFTYSNRTELIKEKEMRFNIGFTFDLDAVMRAIP